MPDDCTPIDFNILDWLLEDTPLSGLPKEGKDKLKEFFKKKGEEEPQLCLVANSDHGDCNMLDIQHNNKVTAVVKCCKFLERPHLKVTDVSDDIVFTIPGVVSVDVKLLGDNSRIEWDHLCTSPNCSGADVARSKALVRVEGSYTLLGALGGGVNQKVGKTRDLHKVLQLACQLEKPKEDKKRKEDK